jgi:hypothetical protein
MVEHAGSFNRTVGDFLERTTAPGARIALPASV